jgi:hypothetical protein
MTLERMKEFTSTMYKKHTEMFDINGFNYLQYIFKSIFGATTTAMLMDAVATYNAEILHHFTDQTSLTFKLDEYFSKTIHVIPYYTTQKKVTKLNGIGMIPEINDKICQVIDHI